MFNYSNVGNEGWYFAHLLSLTPFMVSANLWLALTKAERGSGMAKELTVREMGRRGGKARARNLSKEEIAAIGRKGARKRWNKAKGGKQ
jgi:hypothetical protein